MSRILVVADEPWVRNEVHAALSIGANELIDHDDPSTAAATAADESVDVAIVDLQVASMGGMAMTRAMRDQGGSVAVIMLLDREADAFLADRAGAHAWVAKPFTAAALRAAVAEATGAA